MTPRIFVTPEALNNDAGQLVLNQQDSHYLSQVLRLRPGAEVQVFDGQGNRYGCKLISGDKRQVTLGDVRRVDGLPASALRITLVQGIARGDRMDWLIEKSCELGVHEIMPVNTANSTARVTPERAEKKRVHWRRVAVSACAQSGQDHVPEIHAATALSAAINACRESHIIVGLQPGAAQSLAAWSRENDQLRGAANIALVVGPESGFSDDESDALKQDGAIMLSIGPRVLRTETAGVAALAVLQAIAGDLQ
jgi:16S rRNA (uracil1498-N3)-methyltransferase